MTESLNRTALMAKRLRSMELNTCNEAAQLIDELEATLLMAYRSMQDLVPDPDITFGPAYEGVCRRKDRSMEAIKGILELKA